MSDKAASDEAVRWEVPAIDSDGATGYMTAGRLEAIQREAYEEAWRQGRAEGLEAGAAEIKARVQRLDELLQALAAPFDALDQQIEKQLVELAMTATRQLFRREIREQPTHVIGVVREAIQRLPIASRNVHVHLHPDDAALVREHLAPAEGELAWDIIEDPLISHGGCRVTTDNSQIDATAEARLNSLLQRIAGDERQ